MRLDMAIIGREHDLRLLLVCFKFTTMLPFYAKKCDQPHSLVPCGHVLFSQSEIIITVVNKELTFLIGLTTTDMI